MASREMSSERREQVLRAMAACVVEEGIQGASLRKVAKRANATTGMITHYYRSKDELINEAQRAVGRQLSELIESRGAKTGIERLEALFQLRFTNQDTEVPPWSFFIEYWAGANRSEELRRNHIEAVRRNHVRMEEDIRHEIEAGNIDPDIDPSLAADMLQAIYFGFGLLATLDPEALPADRVLAVFRAAMSRILGVNEGT
jgi:AcrR family transcriptional regulator